MHCSIDDSPSASLYVPAGHGAALALLPVQKPPALHACGAPVAPGHMKPEGHSSVHCGPFCAVGPPSVLSALPDTPGAHALRAASADLIERANAPLS